ncbi:MAG TPA: cellulase family glycosylhydrolase [Candidatus Dormibacteraeota bacterium]|nr:cellulase family glycosylhydrolase [Candidatus Dormibacteraeota bacterium]
MTRRILVIGLVVVVALLTYPGALLVSLATMVTPPPSAARHGSRDLPWLHVAHPPGQRPYIADEEGRMVLLHGAIPASLNDYWSGTDQKAAPFPPPLYPIDPAAYENGNCPGNANHYPYPPLCESDIEQMAALGFNALRLPLAWSLIEPRRGDFSQTYLDRVAQVVEWARARGMYVIVDMHQNAYSRFMDRQPNPALPGGKVIDLGSHSGAPAWATDTDGLPSEDYLGHRELNPAVLEAFSSFWYDRGGIQDEYIKAVAFVAKRFAGDSVVAGYSVFNEPLDGWNLPPGFDDLLLFPFYRRIIDAVTGIHDGLPCWTGFFMPAVCGYPDLGVRDVRHLFFLDTGLLREVTDFPTHLSMPVSSYPNLVLGVHAYTHIYTFDTFDAYQSNHPDKATYPWGGYEQGFAWADREAQAMRAALLVMEFGDSPQWDHVIVTNVLLKEEEHRVGFMFWTWKENGGSGTWGIYDSPPGGNGCIRPAREQLLARPYPRATADPEAAYRYDSSTGGFTFHSRGRAGEPATLLYVPPEVTGQVSGEGSVQLAVTGGPDGSRVVTALPTGGEFGVAISPAPLRLTGCG